MTVRSLGRCACGKVSYETRAAAKRAKRGLGTRADGRMRPYQCQVNTQVWHLGHLHDDVVAGAVGRDRVYTPSEVQAMAREALLRRAGRQCEVCGGVGRDYSHRRTRSVKDAHQWCPCNAVWACRTCHDAMHAAPAQARERGHHVSRYVEEPATIPVRLRGRWFVLLCDGTKIPVADTLVRVAYGTPELLPAVTPNR